MSDPALETLFLPFAEGRLRWPERALFMHARFGPALQRAAFAGLVCEQTSKPEVEILQRGGFDVRPEVEGSYPLILLLPPRQREAARAAMARALERLEPGGVVVASVANSEGARSSERDLEQLAGALETMVKHKCRVFWSGPLNGAADQALFDSWRELDAVRPIADGRFLSRPGVFAWDRIDAASALLADHLPADLRGRAADLGAGFGYLSVELLQRCPNVAALDAYEADARALDLARRNLAALTARARIEYCWHDVTAGLKRRYDVIVTNPPFHAHTGVERPDIGRRFISAAADALEPGGRLWLVANRHLPYEAALTRAFGHVEVVAQHAGFKIVCGRRALHAGRS